MKNYSITVKPIAYIKNDFKEKFGIPRQSGRVSSCSEIIFLPEFQNPDALRGINEFSHLWLIFDFSETHTEKFMPTVRPPRLGGNVKKGVFASRSPFRPNPLGLSSVKLVSVNDTENGKTLTVEGADLLDGTPILDIKPYLPITDIHTDAVGGYSDENAMHSLSVVFPEKLKEKMPKNKAKVLIDCLKEDPRPSYQTDEKVYGMTFSDYNVKFTVKNDTLTVTDVEKL